jgi:hypothetical protein
MKRVLALLLAGLFSVAIVGCRAEGEIDDDDMDADMHSSKSSKTTTVHHDDGDRTVKTTKTQKTVRDDD